jgi:hypothetical protein
VVIERDNRTGDFASLKTLVRFKLRDAMDGTVSAGDKSVYDMIPALEASSGWITDKPEGAAIDGRNRLFLSTDNDGVEDWSGETWFLSLGNYKRLFTPAGKPGGGQHHGPGHKDGRRDERDPGPGGKPTRR